MGYYTHYSMEVLMDEDKIISSEQIILEKLNKAKTDEEKLSLIQEASKIRGVSPDDILADLRESIDEASYALSDDGSSAQEAKWYDWEEDLREFSQKYPEALFVLSGEGEEAGDIWKAYFVNGKMQKAEAKIVIDDYDPAKLH